MTEVEAFTVLTNVATTVIEFRGYELYYKFYSREQAKLTNLKTIGELTAAGFLRICSNSGSVSQQRPPVILVDPVDRNDTTTTVWFMPPSIPAFADYSGTIPRVVPLRRSVENAGVPKTFDLLSFDEFDADIAAIWDEVQATLPDKELHLVLYVLSNGLIDYSPTLYSEARYVGTMIYRLP
jgi:hypothetical protein